MKITNFFFEIQLQCSAFTYILLYLNSLILYIFFNRLISYLKVPVSQSFVAQTTVLNGLLCVDVSL